METRTKLWYCLIGNFVVLLVTILLVFLFRDKNSNYFRFGPQSDLILISIKIDTWFNYSFAIFIIGILKIGELIVNDIGSPILGFNVFNPDKKVITDFTKNELNFLANSMWFINSIRNVFGVIISVTQIDLALANVLISEITSIFTIRYLLNEKTFEMESDRVNRLV